MKDEERRTGGKTLDPPPGRRWRTIAAAAGLVTIAGVAGPLPAAGAAPQTATARPADRVTSMVTPTGPASAAGTAPAHRVTVKLDLRSTAATGLWTPFKIRLTNPRGTTRRTVVLDLAGRTAASTIYTLQLERYSSGARAWQPVPTDISDRSHARASFTIGVRHGRSSQSLRLMPQDLGTGSLRVTARLSAASNQSSVNLRVVHPGAAFRNLPRSFPRNGTWRPFTLRLTNRTGVTYQRLVLGMFVYLHNEPVPLACAAAASSSGLPRMQRWVAGRWREVHLTHGSCDPGSAGLVATGLRLRHGAVRDLRVRLLLPAGVPSTVRKLDLGADLETSRGNVASGTVAAVSVHRPVTAR